MTSASLVALKPRRKWGWFFVAAFVIQAIVLAAIIGKYSADAGRASAAAQYFESSAASGGGNLNSKIAAAAIFAKEATRLNQDVNLLTVLVGVLSVGTLTGVFFGLRRHQ